MSEQGVYGSRLAKVFGLPDPPVLVTRATRDSQLAATEIRGDTPNYFGMTKPFPREDAFLINVTLRDLPDHESWEDGRQAPVTTMFDGQTTIHDLKRTTIVNLQHPFHSIHFYLPRGALDEMARSVGAEPIRAIAYDPGIPMSDPVMKHLALAIAPAFRAPQPVSGLFVDSVTRAVCAHVAHTYGGLRSAERPIRGRLAPWQERRAKEILRASVDGEVSVASLAQECRLSPGHFTRAFRETTGLPPHRWLLRCRIDRARELLADRSLTLSEVALAAGFADQSHLTRVFTRTLGIAPGALRRSGLDATPPRAGRSEVAHYP